MQILILLTNFETYYLSLRHPPPFLICLLYLPYLISIFTNAILKKIQKRLFFSIFILFPREIFLKIMLLYPCIQYAMVSFLYFSNFFISLILTFNMKILYLPIKKGE